VDVILGASGHLGNVLTRHLASEGKTVRPIFRSPPEFEIPDGTDPYLCDPAEIEALVEAFRGAETVYHTAGLVAIGFNAYKKLYEANVELTKNVIDACLAARVSRLVYTATIEAFDLMSGDYPITEQSPIDPERTIMPYGKSKALALFEVEKAAQNRGLDAVSVFPTGFIGPFDHKISPMTRMVIDFLRGRIPAAISGGFDFVDVRDVASGMIGAARYGDRGERFLLPGRFLTVAELFGLLEEISGRRGPRLTIPPVFSAVWGSIAEAFYFVSGIQPRYTRASLKILSLGVSVSGQHASEKLGYAPRPVQATLEDTVKWLRDLRELTTK
jgi:dihydroflavonol-4-reductase